MRITKALRSIIVKSAMNDIPQVDYHKQAQDAIRENFPNNMRSEIRAIHDNNDLRPYLDENPVAYRLGKHDTTWFHVYMYGVIKTTMPSELQSTIADIGVKHDAQKKERENLQDMLERSLAAVSTFKQLRENIPELSKYLPPEPEKSSYPIALVSPMDALRAAGWN